MKVQVNLRMGLGKHKPLKVVHVAAQAVPFVTASLKKGLSDVAGCMPAALASLGVETSLVLPLFQETRAIIQKSGLEMEEFCVLRIRLGAERREAVVHTLDSPLEPSYPVYLVENEALYGHDRMYGMPNDLERFAFFSRAAMELQRELKTAPDIFECHDWHTALIPVYLYRLVSQETPVFKASDTFFSNTRSVMVVHDFSFTGEFASPSLHEAGLGWEMRLPGYAEFYDRLNLLKAGLYRAHRSYARTPGYIQSVAEGKYGPHKFDGVVKERFQAGMLVGLCPKDKAWGPDRDLTPELAVRGAPHVLAVYRSVVERPFPGMEQAEQTSPEVSYLVLTPREKLDLVNPAARELFDKLSESDQSLVERSIIAGEMDRFLAMREAEDMDNVITLLRLEPSVRFEEMMRKEGMAEFLALFHPWDLDRILSIKISIKKCAELLASNPELLPKGKISLHDAMKEYAGGDDTTLLDHVLKMFRTLHIISRASSMKESQLREALEGQGEYLDEESLANATAEFRHFSEIYNTTLARPENRSFLKALVVGVLLHDIGKVIKHDTHPAEGAKLFQKLKEVRGLLSPEELDFAEKMIRYHSVFGDTLIWQKNQDIILELYRLYEDQRTQELAVKFIYLVGIADMNSIGRRGKLSPYDLMRVRKNYHAVLFSKSTEELKERRDDLGIGKVARGRNRWKHLVVGKPPANLSRQEREEWRRNDLASADGMLRTHAHDKIEVQQRKLVKKIARIKSKKKKERLRGQIDSSSKRLENHYYEILDDIKDIFLPNVFKTELEAPFRAQLLIWLVEYYKGHGILNYYFQVSRSREKLGREIEKLRSLLRGSDLALITAGLEFEYDHEAKQMKISVKE